MLLLYVKYKVFFTFLFCFAFLGNATGQNKREKTNLEFISALVDSAAAATAESIDTSFGNKIIFKNMNLKEPLRNYFVQRFEHQLLKKNFQIQYSDSGSCDLYLELYIENANVNYSKIYHSGIFKEKQIQREAEFSYQLKIIRIYTQEIMELKSEQLYKSGRFDASVIKQVEQNSALLGAIQQPSQGLSGWIEFLITTCLFSVIGYLLYVVRSR